MGKFKIKNYFKTFIAIVILMISLLTGKVYARDGVVNNWYVINKEYTGYTQGGSLNGGYWTNWANYCSQNGTALGALGLSPTYTGLVARPDEAFILSCIANFAYNPNVARGGLNRSNIYGVLNDTDDWSGKADPYKESLLSSYSNGKDGGYGYVQNAWWCTLAGKSMPQTSYVLNKTPYGSPESDSEESSTNSPIGTVDTVYDANPEAGLFEVVTDKSSSPTKPKTLSNSDGNEYIGQFDELDGVKTFLDGNSTYKGDFYLHIYDDKLKEHTNEVIKNWYFVDNSNNKIEQWDKNINKIKFITNPGENLNNYYISFEYISHAEENKSKGIFEIEQNHFFVEGVTDDRIINELDGGHVDEGYAYYRLKKFPREDINTYLNNITESDKYNKNNFQIYVYDKDFVLQENTFYFVDSNDKRVNKYDSNTNIIIKLEESMAIGVSDDIFLLSYVKNNNRTVIRYSDPEKKAEGLWGIASAYNDFIKSKAYTDENNKNIILYDEVEFDTENKKIKYKRAEKEYKKEDFVLSKDAIDSRDDARKVYGGDLPTLKIPSIDIEKLFSCKDSEAAVSFDSQMRAYKIGPYYFDYDQSVLTDNSGNKVIIAGLDKFEIYGNNGLIEHADSAGKDGWYYQVNENTESYYNYDVYPPSGSDKKVYIVIPYKEGLTEINNIEYNYNLLRVGANFDLWTGSGQNQTYVKEAARWTESVPGNIAVSNMAEIEIEKKAVDENGNVLTQEQLIEKIGESKSMATFKVTVHYKSGRKDEVQVVKVEAGKKAKVLVPYEEGATFDVEEIDVDEKTWSIHYFENINTQSTSGTVKELKGIDLLKENTVKVVAVNQLSKHEGKIKLVKKLLDGQTADEGTQFKFKVTINSQTGGLVTSSKGKSAKDSFTDDVTLEATSGMITSEEITYDWYGDQEPTYAISEYDIPDGYEKVSIQPESGTLKQLRLIGDVNNDGIIDDTDALIIGDYSINAAVIDILETANCDDDPSSIDEGDARCVRAYAQGVTEPTKIGRVGKLLEGDVNAIEVTATNKKKTPEPISLTLIKSIKGGVSTEENFTFKVKVEYGTIQGETLDEQGYATITLAAGEQKNIQIQPYYATTPVKYWVYEVIDSNSKTEPNRFTVSKNGEITDDSDETTANSSKSITKIDIPATRPENGWYAIVKEKELANGTSVTVDATNEVTTPTTGKVRLTKQFTGEPSKKDRVATFKVTVEVPIDVKLDEKMKVSEEKVETLLKSETEPETMLKSGKEFIKEYSLANDPTKVYYVKYITGYVKAGDTEVTKWKNGSQIFGWDENVEESTIWDSGDFSWYGDYELKYHIEEQQVFEIEKDKQEKVTNQYTSVISPSEGKLSNDDNLNLVHAYNGDKIVKLTVSKQLDPNGEIDNDKKFAFDVRVKGVKKVLTTRGGIDENEVFTDTPSVSVNSPVTYAFEYEGENAPTFEVKETDNENLVKIDVKNATGEVEDIKDDNSDKVIGKKGTLQPGADVTVTATNKLKIYKNIAITKKISGPADTDEEFVFKVKVKVDEEEEEENAKIIIKKGETTGETWTSKEYDCTDSKPTYSIEEIEVWSVDKDGNRIDITGKYNPSITPNIGTLGDQVEHTIDVQAFNNENAHQPIQLKKTFKKELENSVEVTMKVEVTAPEGGFTKFPEGFDKTGGTKEITLTIGKNEKEQTWASEGDFYWKDEGYSLTENTKVTEIKVDGKPIEESIYAASEATLDWIDSLPIWEIVNTEKNEGYLKLTKTTSEKLTNTEIFVFKTNIGGKTSYVAERVLKGKDTVDAWMYVPDPNANVDYIPLFNNESKWTKGAWESEHKSWNSDEEAPKYSISEEVKSYKVEEDGSITPEENKYFSNLPVEGVLENKEILVEAVNTKKEEQMATLKIVKKLSNTQDSDKEFTFDINVDGITEYYQNDEWIQATSFSTGENGIKVSINNPSEQYQFKFAEGTTPTYTVKERTGDTYTIEDISTGNAEETKIDENGNKYVEGNLEAGKDITVTATNKLKIYKNIAITKTISGSADTDEVFVFKVKVGEEEETVEITVKKGETTGETWTSKEYDCTDSNLDYLIEEIQALSVDKDGNRIDITGKYNPSITPNSGTLGDQVEHTIDVKVFNQENYHEPLQFKKTFTKKLEKPVDVTIKLEVTAPEGGFEIVPTGFEKTGGTKEITLTIGENQDTQSWKSEGEFYWKDAGYSLIANTKVTEIKVDGKPIEESDYVASKATLDWIDNLPIWEIVNTEYNKGRITIKKTVSGKADTDEIFEFKVRIGNNEEKTVYLKVKAGDEAASSYSYDKENWQELTDGKWISEEVKWKTTESAPSYSISEIYVEGYKPTFKSNDTSANYNEATQTYTGTLKADGIIDGTIDVDIQNNKDVKEKYAQLQIKKVVKGNTNKAKTFTFNVKVSGAINLQVVSGGSALIEQGGKNITITNFTTDDSGNIQFKNAEELISETFKFKYTGEVAPTFEVTEAEGNDYKLEEMNSNAEKGTFTKSERKYTGTLKGSDKDNDNSNLITVTATNKVQFSNKIEIKKTLDGGPAGTNEIFKFDVTVTDSDGNETTETAEIHVEKGKTTGTWTSDNTYTWYDENKAPTYEISDEKAFQADDNWNEIKDITAKYNPQGLPKTGVLNGNASEIKVDVVNYVDIKKGYISVEKKCVYINKSHEEKDINTNDTYDFVVTIAGNDNCKLQGAKDDNTLVFEYGLKSGEKKDIEVVWTGSEAPKYRVEEINLEGKNVESVAFSSNKPTKQLKIGDNFIEGKLVAAETIDEDATVDEDRDVSNITLITCKNIFEQNSARLVVKKDFYETKDKTKDGVKALAETTNKEFAVKVTINGKFRFGKEENFVEEKVLFATLNKDNSWFNNFGGDHIYWYGDKAPTFTVEEIDTEGWECVATYIKTGTQGQEGGQYTLKDSQNSGFVLTGETTEITVVNKPIEKIKLTMQLGGMVWDDGIIDVKGLDGNSTQNGVYDSSEDKLKDIPVNLYKVITDNKNNKEINRILVERTVTRQFTDDRNDIRWLVKDISVPVVNQTDIGENKDIKDYTASYEVEFEYDGQKYEPTDLLKYTNTEKELTAGSAEEFRNGTNNVRSYYANSSMAKETENNSAKITEIKGNLPIDSNGDTQGLVVYDKMEKGVSYHADNAGTSYPVISKLNTTTTDGIIDTFKSKATTKAAGLTFPFEGDICIGEDDKVVLNVEPDETNFVGEEVTNEGITTKYRAIYNYCKNINLGLVEKGDVDIGLTKNLSNVKVVVKENLYQYNYSGYYDLTEEKTDTLEKGIKVKGEGVTEALPIGLYKSDYNYRAEIYNNDGKVYDKLSTLYKTFNKTLDDTEMDIYLTYQIKVKNASSDYNVKINSIDDYYDDSLELVKEEERKYIKKKTIGGGTPVDVNSLEVVGTVYGGYNGTSGYNWTDIETGINANITGITYNKMRLSFSNLTLEPEGEWTIPMDFKVKKDKYDPHKIKLGQKANVAEISSYSTTYAYDFDNGGVQHTKNQDAGKIDRDSAPGNVDIRTHNKKSWYEDDTFAAPIARITLNPETENDQRNISGSVWEDKKQNPDENNYRFGNGTKDSGEKFIKEMTTELVEKVMIPNYKTDSDGKYVLDSDKNRIIENYTAYDFVWPTDIAMESLGGRTIENATGFDSTTTTQGNNGTYKFNNIPTGDYVVRFTYGDKQIDSASYSTAKFYNGQDYKSSIYPNVDQIPTSLDLSKYNGANEAHSNVAVDSEVRRLQVIQKSREITNENGRVLASSRSMEDLKKLGYSEEEIKQNKDKLLKDYYMYAETPMISFDDLGKTYNLKNIDFAIEERPLTELSLDKQIKEILITTSDGKTLMDAVYNITYSINNEGKITANVTLDETKSTGIENLQALDRDKATNNGFRYINVDSEVLQGTTITVTYQLSAINSGEVDYTGELADASFKINETEYSWNAEGFDKACEDLSTKLATYNNDKQPQTSQGTYVGNHYYYGKDIGNTQDVKVTTSVKELVDYVDNDMTFDATLNSAKDTSWKTTTEFELKGLVENTGEIKDSNGTIFSTNGNLITSINDVNKNSIVGKELETVRYNNVNKYTPEAQIQLTISKFVSADSNTLQIDNIAEIIRYTNTVGRRDILTITGNTDPADAIQKVSEDGNKGPISEKMKYERDTSATELITLSPPTGSSIFIWRLQVAGTIATAMAIVAGGIILIKKKVLK